MTASPSPAPNPAPSPVPSARAVPPALRRPPGPAPTAARLSRLHTATAGVDGTDPAVPLAETQGALALDLAPPGAPRLPGLRVVPAAGDAAEESPDTEAHERAEVQRWAARFAQAVVEVTGGDRPVTQLLRWTTLPIYSDLERRARVVTRGRTAGQRRRTVRPQVRSVHVCLPRPGRAEVSVHVRYGARSRALAARLERRSGRWTCTALELG
jgi:hypothetical protein